GNAIYLNTLKDERIQEAIRLWRKALTKEADVIQIMDLRRTIGDALLHSGDINGAIDEYQAAIRIDSNNLDAHVGLADAYGLLGDSAKGYAEISVVLEADSIYTPALSIYADMSIIEHQFSKALRSYYLAVKFNPSTCRYYGRIIKLSNLYINTLWFFRDRYFIAGKLHNWDQSGPMVPWPYYKTRNQMDSSMAKWFEREKKEYQQLYRGCVDSLLESNFTSGMLRKYNQRAFAKADSVAYYDMAAFLDALAAAIHHLQAEVIALAKDNAPRCSLPLDSISWEFITIADSQAVRVYADKADRYLDQGKLDKAKEAYSVVLQVDSNNARASLGLGIIYHQQGQLDSAKKYLSQAIRLTPNSVEAMGYLGDIMIAQRKPEEAMQLCQEAINFTSDISILAKLHLLMGAAWLIQRDTLLHNDSVLTFAQMEIEKAFGLDSNYAQIHYWRGVLLENLEDTSGVRTEYERAIELNDHFAPAFNALGVLFYKQNKVKEACRVLKKAIQLDPNNEIYKSNLKKASRDLVQPPVKKIKEKNAS
ncbi:MAG: tetratricopeptide repeat protein, partial [candidate division Zixibacteria bacterium]|nr:tetratricopeptide repeat protein [candidate division Zixibacteria bacterium]